MISRTLKNGPPQRLAHLRRANPKTKYPFTHSRYCVSQMIGEGGDEVVDT